MSLQVLPTSGAFLAARLSASCSLALPSSGKVVTAVAHWHCPVISPAPPTWPRGPMDKASAYGTGDCRFESYWGHLGLRCGWEVLLSPPRHVSAPA